MPRTRDPQPLPAHSTLPASRPWRIVQMVLGAALIAGGVGFVGTRLLLVLFYAPAALYTDIFVGGDKAAAAGANFERAVLEGVAMLIAMAYGALLFVCGAAGWRVAKASLWFCGVGLAAAAAFTAWQAMAGAAA